MFEAFTNETKTVRCMAKADGKDAMSVAISYNNNNINLSIDLTSPELIVANMTGAQEYIAAFIDRINADLAATGLPQILAPKQP